jgi:hypothetical protein
LWSTEIDIGVSRLPPHKQDEDKEENKELDEMRTYHKRSVERRAKMFAQAEANAVNAAVENKNGLTRP